MHVISVFGVFAVSRARSTDSGQSFLTCWVTSSPICANICVSVLSNPLLLCAVPQLLSSVSLIVVGLGTAIFFTFTMLHAGDWFIPNSQYITGLWFLVLHLGFMCYIVVGKCIFLTFRPNKQQVWSTVQACKFYNDTQCPYQACSGSTWFRFARVQALYTVCMFLVFFHRIGMCRNKVPSTSL